ncbi:hypothetical protein QBC35DRAFT_473521 [Podospora australis]|uniref:Uncharacterized protein n=1 Tax=Podospora australis TaxID=1536484 RepID=A0AAN6WVY1_9PEZI|nr:hypothetical protein QBC35DRAFT_473521 [Podospora australis]
MHLGKISAIVAQVSLTSASVLPGGGAFRSHKDDNKNDKRGVNIPAPGPIGHEGPEGSYDPHGAHGPDGPAALHGPNGPYWDGKVNNKPADGQAHAPAYAPAYNNGGDAAAHGVHSSYASQYQSIDQPYASQHSVYATSVDKSAEDVPPTPAAAVAGAGQAHGDEGKNWKSTEYVPAIPAATAGAGQAHGDEGKNWKSTEYVPAIPAATAGVGQAHGDEGKNWKSTEYVPAIPAATAGVGQAHGDDGKNWKGDVASAHGVTSSFKSEYGYPGGVGTPTGGSVVAHPPPKGTHVVQVGGANAPGVFKAQAVAAMVAVVAVAFGRL